MDIVAVSRWVPIAAYAGIGCVAFWRMFWDYDRARQAASGFIALASFAWAFFYLGLAFGWYNGQTTVVVLSRVMHLLTIGVFVTYLTAIRTSRDADA